MLDSMWNFMNSTVLLKCMAWIGVPLTVVLIVLFCLKSHRDERGWKILGKASIISFVFLIIIVNVAAKVTGRLVYYDYEIGYFFWANTIQLIYNSILLLEIVSIAILRKRE